MGSYIFKLELDPLNSELIEKAKNELNETVDAVNKGLADLRELLQGCCGIPCAPNNNLNIFKIVCAVFIRVSYSWRFTEPVLQEMKQLYHYNMTHPVYSDNLTPMDDQDVLSSGLVVPLPVRNRDGCRLFLIQCGSRWNPNEISLDQMLRGIRLVTESALFEPETQVCGVHLLFDLGGFTLSHALCFTPTFAKAELDWVQKCYPGRIKGLHMVHNPFLFNMVFALFKPLLTEKLRKRIYFHGTNKESLLKVVDRKAVPKYMGGDLDVPIQPVGKPLWEYYCNFQQEFEESVKLGYLKKK
ncbi:GSCOCG00012358001-RA-CDS [Cotesia congregata]|nr:GSCOCG00012358001-RA-CDS [Cotesia congregata]